MENEMQQERKLARVLIVDDEPLTTEMIGMFLRLSGHEAIEAGDCAEARAKLAYTDPDVILLDIMLPDMSGIELCRELRASPKTSNTPIIMISATAPPKTAEAAEAGANEYLIKPINLNKLLSVLSTVMAQQD